MLHKKPECAKGNMVRLVLAGGEFQPVHSMAVPVQRDERRLLVGGDRFQKFLDRGACAGFRAAALFFTDLEEINEIKRGIGKLLMNSAREHDKIAIYHAPYSVHAATIDAKRSCRPKSSRRKAS